MQCLKSPFNYQLAFEITGQTSTATHDEKYVVSQISSEKP